MRISLPFVLAALLAGLVGTYLLRGEIIVGGRGANDGSPPPPGQRVAEAGAEAIRVRAKIITASDRVQILPIRGRTQADTRVAVAAETSGRVLSRPVKLGDRVDQGDLLCQLDPGARESRYQEAQAALEQARADLEAARQLNEKGFSTDINLKTQQARFDSAEAVVREAAIELDRTQIRAPISGLIEDNLAEVGAMLSPGVTCAVVINLNPLLVIGQVAERDIGSLNVGMEAGVRLVTGEERLGTIAFLAASADADTRTFRAEIEIPNPDFSLRAGVTAQAGVRLPSVKAHQFSSAYLTLDDQGTIGVRTVTDDNKAAFLPVELIGEDENGVWVGGLPDEVRIITVGQEFVRNGETVEPVIETASAQE